MTAYIDRMKNRPATVKGTLFRPVGLGEVLHQRCDVLFRSRCTAGDHAVDDFLPFIVRRLAGADQVQTMAAAAAGVETLLHCCLVVPSAELSAPLRDRNVR